MPDSRSPEAVLTDGLITVQLPDGWVAGPSLPWDPEVCDEDCQQVGHPEGQDMWQVSVSLGRMRDAPAEVVAYNLVVFCQTNLPQPPTIAVGHRTRPVHEREPGWHQVECDTRPETDSILA